VSDGPIYLDHHATTRVDARVLAAMLPFFREHFGNASSRSHGFGAFARDAVEQARVQVAGVIGGRASELIFTSGATESDNLALHGVLRARAAESRDHLVIGAVEHSAVRAPAARWARAGGRVTVLRVNREGHVDLDQLAEVLDARTALVSVGLFQSEVGTRHDLDAVGRLARRHGAYVHCDAAQGLGYSAFDVRELPVDLVSLSAHKAYGPKGVGALWIRRDGPRVQIEPLVEGGGQERGLRSGTLDVPGIVGFGVAAELVARGGRAEAERLASMRDGCWQGLADLEGVHLNGPPLDGSRHPGNLHVGIEGVDGEGLLLALAPRVALSSGSACASEQRGPSVTLEAMGVPKERASLRFGFGRDNTPSEVSVVVALVRETIERLRASSPSWRLRHETVEW
jgi:cysteine desulfurase